MQLPYYASVGGAPEVYGSRRVCESICLYFQSRFSTTLEN